MAEVRPEISVVDGRVEARWPADRPGAGVAVDFSTLALRGGAEGLRGMPLVRACGAALAHRGAMLVDATAGLGYDAYILARAGFLVTAIERSPDVAKLLADGLARAGHPFSLVVADAREALAALHPEVIYLDPMYPPKRRGSALPPKEMQIVRALVGSDPDSRELFTVAREVAPRVVVKRPLHAEPLGDPAWTVEGKLARFDVYVRYEAAAEPSESAPSHRSQSR